MVVEDAVEGCEPTAASSNRIAILLLGDAVDALSAGALRGLDLLAVLAT